MVRLALGSLEPRRTASAVAACSAPILPMLCLSTKYCEASMNRPHLGNVLRNS